MRFPSKLLDVLTTYDSVFLRLALGVTFLAAVSDRFGMWGPPASPNVAWGNLERFASYAATLNPWAPAALIPAIVWMATIAPLRWGFTWSARHDPHLERHVAPPPTWRDRAKDGSPCRGRGRRRSRRALASAGDQSGWRPIRWPGARSLSGPGGKARAGSDVLFRHRGTGQLPGEDQRHG